MQNDPTIKIDLEADNSGLDQGLAQAQKRVGEFHGAVEKSAQGMIAASQQAEASIGQVRNAAEHLERVAKDVVNGDFSKIPATLAQAAIAAPELASAVFALVAPFAAAAAAVAVLGKAAYEGQQEMKAMDHAIAMTSASAGQTRGDLLALAASLSEHSRLTITEAKNVVTHLAASGRIGAESFKASADLVAAYSAATGTSAAEATKYVVSLFENPAKGAAKLNETMHFLSATELERIETLQRMGQESEAQLLLAEKLQTHLAHATPELGLLSRAWAQVAKDASAAWAAMMNVGAEKTTAQKLAEAKAALDEMNKGNFTGFGWSKQREDKQAEVNQLAVKQAAEQDAAAKSALDAKTAAYDRETAAIRNANSELYKRQLIQEKIDRLRASQGSLSGDAAASNISAIEGLQKQLEEKDKKPSLGRDLEPARLKAEYAERFRLIKEGTELEQQLLKTAQAQGLISEDAFQQQMYEAVQAGMVKRAGALSAQLQATENPVDRERILGEIRSLGTESAKAAAQYQEAIAKIDAARRKWMSDSLAGEGKRVQSIEEHNKALREELETVGLSTEQLAAYTQGKAEAAAAAEYLAAKDLEEAAATLEGIPDLAEARDYYLALAAAKREAGKALQEEGQLQAAVTASKASAAEWKHGWEETDRLARDVFTSWGTDGGNAAKKIGKSLEKALLSAIYEAQLKPIAFQLYASATNALGMSNGSGGALGSIGSIGNTVSGGSSLINAFTGGTNSVFSSIGTSSLLANTGIGSGLQYVGANGVLSGLGAVPTLLEGGEFMTALGAALPGIGMAIAAIAMITSLMGKGGGPKTGGDSYLSFTGDTASAMSSSQLATLMPNLGGNTPGVGYFTPDNGNATVASAISPAGASVAETIRKLGGSVDGLKLGLGYDTDPQGTASSRVQSGVYRADGTAVYDSMRDVGRDADMAKEMTVELQRMTLGAIKAASGIPKIFKDVVDGIDLATASAEQMTAALTQIGNTQTLVDYTKLDPFEAWTTAQETAAEGVMGVWSKQEDAARKLIETFDGSAASTANLAASVTALAQTEAQVVAYLNQSLAALRANTQQDAESMYLSTLDNQGQYQYRMAMSSRLEGQMATASTPEEVMALNGQLRNNYQAAWGLLSPEQQRQYGAQYFGSLDQSTGQFSGGYLGTLQTSTEASLAPFGDAVSASHDLLSSDSLVSQLSDVLGILPDKLQAVADDFAAVMGRFEAAAAAMEVAASTPVEANVTVFATTTAGVEVNA